MNVTKTKAPSIDIGISAAKREKIAHGLSALLAVNLGAHIAIPVAAR